MNKKLIIGVIVVVVLIIIGVAIANSNKSTEPVVQDQTQDIDHDMMNADNSTMPDTANSQSTSTTTGVSADVGTGSTKSFTVTGNNFSFDPKTISVKKGDTVKITFVNKQGFHDFKLDEFNVATKQFQGPGQEVVQFVASKAGSFQYYCSVGKHREMGMWGTLVVTE